jgi:YVTN family beta-propeller protein
VRNFTKRLIPAAVVVLGTLGALPTGVAQAAASTTLPITSFYQIVADSAHGHLFISRGSSSLNEIIVANLAGKEVTTITGQNGVMGIALSPDGSTLYAALGSDHSVTAIDTTTLKQTASYPLGDANTPLDVAVQSGKVWVSYDTGTVGAAAIGDIDLTATTPAFETQAAMGGWYAAPELAADAEGTGVLVAAEPGMDPSSVASYNVTVDPATVRAQSTSFTNCENLQDLAVAPGGSEFVLACGAPYAHYRYSTADLSQQGSYASTNYPDAVAIDSKGDVAAGITTNSSAPDIYIYPQDGDATLNTYNFGASGADLVARGLAWSADGSQLFAVLQNSDSTYSLQVIDAPTLLDASLTLAAGAATRNYDATIHITAHLGTTDSNRTVSIYAQAFGSTTRTLLKSGKVNSSGDLSVSHKTPRSTTFSVVFSGDAKYGPRTITRTVRVRAKVSGSQSGYYGSKRVGRVTYRLYHRTGVLDAHATVTPNKRGECVEFEVQEYFQGAWQANVTSGCVKLSNLSRASGKFKLTQADLGYHYRIRADYIRSSKDTGNLSNDSAWQYLMIET